MANKRKDYSNVNANKILKDFENLSQVDPLIKSQRSKDVYFRALLYKVLILQTLGNCTMFTLMTN